MKRILLISGPSGIGKNTLIHALLDKQKSRFGYIISHTTRKPRESEVNGVNYHFSSKLKFEEELKKNHFIEHTEIHNNYYGTHLNSLLTIFDQNKVAICDVDVIGVRNFQNYFKDQLNTVVKTVALLPPTTKVLEDRLRSRNTENELEILKRLELGKLETNELLKSSLVDHQILNFNSTSHSLKNVLSFMKRNDLIAS